MGGQGKSRGDSIARRRLFSCRPCRGLDRRPGRVQRSPLSFASL